MIRKWSGLYIFKDWLKIRSKTYGSIPGVQIGTWWETREGCSSDSIHAYVHPMNTQMRSISDPFKGRGSRVYLVAPMAHTVLPSVAATKMTLTLVMLCEFPVHFRKFLSI